LEFATFQQDVIHDSRSKNKTFRFERSPKWGGFNSLTQEARKYILDHVDIMIRDFKNKKS
jgi:hypothetical protein